jgi:hypothetical protein
MLSGGTDGALSTTARRHSGALGVGSDVLPGRRRSSLSGSRRVSKGSIQIFDMMTIVDLRLFDFALPKGAAKIEITYIEVNHSATTYTGQDEEPETEDEQIVLAPENIKEIYIDLDGYTELQVSPIKPNRFVSRSGSFPLEQKWTRPQGLRYPVEAEVTLELVVKNTRYLTQPYPITLKGTTSVFNHCATT